jgi:hypothetical protein
LDEKNLYKAQYNNKIPPYRSKLLTGQSGQQPTKPYTRNNIKIKKKKKTRPNMPSS